jgi:hypothetical protein
MSEDFHREWKVGLLLGLLFVTPALAADGTVETSTSLLVQIFMFATLIAGFIHQYVMKKQERTWAEKESKRLEEKAERDAANIAAKVDAAATAASVGVTTQATQVAMTLAANATELAKKVTDTAERLAMKVEAGTDRAVIGSEKAYNEANTVNNKIAQLQEQNVSINKVLLELAAHIKRTEEQAERNAAVAEETLALNKRVDAILEERVRRMDKSKTRRAP